MPGRLNIDAVAGNWDAMLGYCAAFCSQLNSCNALSTIGEKQNEQERNETKKSEKRVKYRSSTF